MDVNMFVGNKKGRRAQQNPDEPDVNTNKKERRDAFRAQQNEETRYWKEQMDKLAIDETRKQLSLPPSLTKKQRFELHKYAAKVSLKSKSTGAGDNRFLTVFKRTATPFLPTDTSSSIYMKLSDDAAAAINKLLENCPVSDEEKQSTVFKAIENEQQVRLPYVFGDARSKLRFNVPKMPHVQDEFRTVRETLPIYAYRDEILATINSNQVVVISGETGSGKTTQVPQYIMEDCSMRQQECRIICTQPRRLAATSIADRISQERNDTLGKSVGYQIRLDSRITPTTNLILTTSGYLLRCLTGSKNDEVYKSLTHLILDEVHEREKITDFLLIAIKDAIAINPNLKVILMSATLDSKMFSEYFFECPVINVPGRTFDVDVNYLGEILMMTGYKTKHMRAYMTENKGPKVLRVKESDRAGEVAASAEQPSNPEESSDVDEGDDDVEDDDDDSPKPDVPEDDVEFYDECLDECMETELETTFEQIYYLVTDENMPIDYLHSQKSRSALTIAAEKGFYHVITTLLSFGANPRHGQADGKTALDYALENGHESCYELLSQYVQSAAPQAIASNEESAAESEAEARRKALQQFTLAAYQLTNSTPNEIDHELLLSLITHLHSEKPVDGSILVFLPGYDDIMVQKNLIEQCMQLKNHQLFVLHSGMNGTNSAEQRRVFERPPRGQRKIILSTNIAETSLTINDVVYVIDAGKVKQQTYDSVSNTTCLTSTWISKACAKQRSGRAGRVQNGFCYRMYSVEHYETMEDYTLPEILRVPLTEICLNAKILAGHSMSIEEFLVKALQPPPVNSIRQSVNLLKQIDALDANENITYLGIHLADLPVDCQLGKCILYSVVLRCLDPIVTIAAALSVKDPFMLPLGNEAAKINVIKKEFAADSLSDHKMLLNTYEAWSDHNRKHNERKFCAEKMLCNGNMQMILGVRRLIIGHLQMVGIMKENTGRNSRKLNENSNNWKVIKACLTAGTYPNVCRIKELNGHIYSKQDKKLLPHLSSVLRDRTTRGQLDPNVIKAQAQWLIHGEKSRISRFSLIRNITVVPAIDISLFSGSVNLPPSCIWSLEIGKWNVDGDENEQNDYDLDDDDDIDLDEDNINNSDATFTIDEWISFSMSKSEAQLIYQLRQKFAALFVRFLKSPSAFELSNQELGVYKTIVDVLGLEDRLCDGSAVGSGEKLLSGLKKVDRPTPNGVAARFWPSNSGQMPAIMSSAYTDALQPPHKRNKKKNNKNQSKRSGPNNMTRQRNRQGDNQPHTSNGYYSTTLAPSSSRYQPHENPIQQQFNGLSINQPQQVDRFHDDGAASSTGRRNRWDDLLMPNHLSCPRFFILTIKNVGLLYETVYSRHWQFNMSLQHFKAFEREYPATMIIFFYVQTKQSIFGAGTFSSRNKNQYYIDTSTATSRKPPLRPLKAMTVASDTEMSFQEGFELYQYCQDVLSRPVRKI